MKMTKQFISELRMGDNVNSTFSIKYKHPPEQYKNGFRFTLGLADKTGEIELKYWGGEHKESVLAVYNSFKENDVVAVVGKVSSFRDRLEIHINEGAGSITSEESFEKEDFVLTAKENIAKVMHSIMSTIEAMKNPHLKQLLESFFSEKEFYESFSQAPAAMYMHHAYIGGLAVHTSHVVELCKSIIKIYPNLDSDLVLAGAILHDIGKIKEFSVTTNIKQTEEGMLCGHINLGEEMIFEQIKRMKDFPNTLKIKMAHMMLSHHGNNEYGSPQEPSFPEAVAVYYADEYDSKVEQFLRIKESANTEDFRVYSKRLGRGIYLK
jgi:3'-5' exoribonuclease